MHDPVNHPAHYTSHPSGVECIQITRHMSFNLGNALKYIWRCDLKKDAIEDLRKARFYLDEEINLRTKQQEPALKSYTGSPTVTVTGGGSSWFSTADKDCGK